MTEPTAPDAGSADRRIEDIDIERIMALLPHRYPMLMIDRMIDITLEQSATGVKNVTVNEPFFPGHFPGHPVMPGVMLIEAMAQTAAALVALSVTGGLENKVVYFMTIDKARFRRPVRPGDTVHFPVNRLRRRGDVWKFEGQAKVGETVVADAEFGAMIYNVGGSQIPPA